MALFFARVAPPAGRLARVALACAALTAAPPLGATANGATPCGTAVIPNNFGQGDPAAPTSLNPILSGAQMQNLQASLLLFRPLVWLDARATMDAAQSLATRIEPLDGNTRYRVTLKPWRWSDGAPITADDVVFCWERIALLGNAYPTFGQGGIPDQVASVRAVNASQVEFRLTHALNPVWFTLNGLSLIYPLPRHAWGDIGRDDMWHQQNDPATARVVDGPFKLTEFHDDRYAAYAPNPLYGGHPAALARLVVTFLEGDNPLHALQAGDADVARVPYPLWNRLRGVPGFIPMALPEAYGYAAIVLNMRAPDVAFLQDVAVRRALAKSVDQAGIVRLVYRGLSRENHVPIPTAGAAWRSPQSRAGTPDLSYDPAAASAALQDAGWRPGADGVRVKRGQRMALTIVSGAESDDTAEIQALQIVQRGWRAIGVALSLRRMSQDQFFQTINAPAGWDAASLFNTLFGVPDGSGYFDTGGSSNFGGFTDPHMDALIHDSVSRQDGSALFAYQDYVAATLPWIILPQGQFGVMVARRLHGVAQMNNPLGFWSPEYLWVEDGACHAPDDTARH